MPVVKVDVPELLHYESRSIRDELQASKARLDTSKKSVNASLVPQQGQLMAEQWQKLANPTEVDQEETVASGNPHYEQMRTALLQFEREQAYNAPARERAFYNALRSVLTESLTERDTEQRNTRLHAGFKWFTKHRPRPSAPDPHLSAALASSLSLQAPAQDPGLLATVKRNSPTSTALHNTQQLRPFVVPSGTKQEFFSIYSKEPSPFTASPEVKAASTRSTPQAKPSMFGRPSAAKDSNTLELPVGMQPAIPGRGRPLPSSSKGGLVPTIAPKSAVVRLGTEEELTSGATAMPRTANLAKNMQNVISYATEASAGQSSEDVELAELRSRFARMDRHHQRFEEDIAAKMRAWALQRARLEEEITRRQESSRFAAPLVPPRPDTLACPGAPENLVRMKQAQGQQEDPMAHTYLSPYAQYSKMSAQVNSANLIAEAKAAYLEEAVADAEELRERLGEVGVNISPEVWERALVPVRDKTFLECIAKLPKPGDHLPGRPGGPAKKTKRKGSSKGKRKGSAARKRAVSR